MTDNMKQDGTLKGYVRRDDEAMCKCGKNPATKPHRCPYAEAICESTDDEYCTCCNDCVHECCLDI